MENASKALIIAGAILLSILIIALGVFIFNQAKNASGDMGINDQKAQSFNSWYEQYEGTVSGSQARSIVEKVRTNNNTTDDTSGTKIKLATPNVATATDVITSAMKTEFNLGDSYDVSFTYKTTGATKGYIDTITISNH